ncbi:Integrase [Theobroma cacao]|nr:Integrase [Theobroma cacao]
MVATTWSDSDTSSSEAEEEKAEERANLCLMALDDESKQKLKLMVGYGIGDLDMYTCVYFLAHKNDALPAFISHCRKVENEKGLAIVSIRSDHGGEFEGDKFENFCYEKGLDHNCYAPKTPQQNGVVERKNQTLKEKARTMLCENNQPKYFWAEAVNTVAYILNRVSIRAMISKTA